LWRISEIVGIPTLKFPAIFLNDSPLSTRLHTSSLCSKLKNFPFLGVDIPDIKIRKQQNITVLVKGRLNLIFISNAFQPIGQNDFRYSGVQIITDQIIVVPLYLYSYYFLDILFITFEFFIIILLCFIDVEFFFSVNFFLFFKCFFSWFQFFCFFKFVCISCMQFLSGSKVLYYKNRISEISYTFSKDNNSQMLPYFLLITTM
ncbi:hypothetical protein T11_13454, partial [Trichinella zimbabwensis]